MVAQTRRSQPIPYSFVWSARFRRPAHYHTRFLRFTCAPATVRQLKSQSVSTGRKKSASSGLLYLSTSLCKTLPFNSLNTVWPSRLAPVTRTCTARRFTKTHHAPKIGTVTRSICNELSEPACLYLDQSFTSCSNDRSTRENDL